MKVRLRTRQSIVTFTSLVVLLGVASLVQSFVPTSQAPESSEAGFISFSPRGATSGAIIPASCESGYDHGDGCGSLPIGYHDTASCTVMTGWTCDPDNYSQPLSVNVYKDGPLGTGDLVGEYTANTSRPDAAYRCGGYANHGFSITPPNSLKDGSPHSIYVYAVDNQYSGTTASLIGTPRSITCAAPPGPSVTTKSANSITTTAARLRSTVDPNGSTTRGWFRYTTNSNRTTCNDTFGTRVPAGTPTGVANGTATNGTNLGNGTVGVADSRNITGLSPNTKYYYCAIASNPSSEEMGAIISFTTLPLPPIVTTRVANNITATAARLRGTANPNGATATGWFRYRTTPAGTCADTNSFGTRVPATGGTNLGVGTVGKDYVRDISGLAPNTTYYYCAIANNAGGNGMGSIDSFTTSSNPSPPNPDLTAGSVSPASATAGTATTFSATVSNANASTGASFSNFFQVATLPNGGGTLTDLAPTTMGALAAGGSNTAASPAQTFSIGATPSVRACADKSSSGNNGVITESNEGNNCGTWTNVTVSPPSPPQPPGGGPSLSCSRAPLGTPLTAPVTVTYTAVPSGGATTPYTFRDALNNVLQSGSSLTYQQNYTINGSYSVTVGASNVSPVACGTAFTVEGGTGSCGTLSSSITANPNRVNVGNTTDIAWTSSGVETSCVITENGNTIQTIPAVSCSIPSGSTNPDRTINAQTTYCITCDGNTAARKCVTVNILPIFQEF